MWVDETDVVWPSVGGCDVWMGECGCGCVGVGVVGGWVWWVCICGCGGWVGGCGCGRVYFMALGVSHSRSL